MPSNAFSTIRCAHITLDNQSSCFLSSEIMPLLDTLILKLSATQLLWTSTLAGSLDITPRRQRYRSLLALATLSKEMFRFISTELFTGIDLSFYDKPGNYQPAPKANAKVGLLHSYNNPYSPLKRLERFAMASEIHENELEEYIPMMPLLHTVAINNLSYDDPLDFGILLQLPNLTTLIFDQGRYYDGDLDEDQYNTTIPKYLAAQTTLTRLDLFNQHCSNQTFSDILASKPSLTRLRYTPIDGMITLPSHIQRLEIHPQDEEYEITSQDIVAFTQTHPHIRNLFLYIFDIPCLYDLGSLSCMSSLSTINIFLELMRVDEIAKNDFGPMMSSILSCQSIQNITILIEIEDAELRCISRVIDKNSFAVKISRWFKCKQLGIYISDVKMNRAHDRLKVFFNRGSYRPIDDPNAKSPNHLGQTIIDDDPSDFDHDDYDNEEDDYYDDDYDSSDDQY
eukprot:gene15229-18022_t